MAKTTKTYFKMSDTGLQRVVETAEDMQLTDRLAQSLSGKVIRKLSNILHLGGNYGFCGLSVAGGGQFCWSARVKTLPLSCHCSMQGDTLVTDFGNSGADKFVLQWAVPDDMNLVLMVSGVEIGSNSYRLNNQFLVAVNAKGQPYKIPVSNIHNEGRLCSGMGDDNHTASSSFKLLQDCLSTFDKSDWNDHLWNDEKNYSRRESSKQMFRFKPTKEGMEQLPSQAHWEGLCNKLGNEFVNENIITTLMP